MALKSPEIFQLMKAYIEAGLATKAIKKCNAIFNFEILEKPKGKIVFSFWIDVTKSGQKAGEGKNKKAHSTFRMTDAVFYKMCRGKMNPQMAFIRRKLVIKGNFRKASSFTPDLFPKPTQENIEKYSKLAVTPKV